MKKHWQLLLFVLPALVLYVGFFVLPCLAALGLSVTDWNGISPDYKFVGLTNFITLLVKDVSFHQAFANNLKYMAFVVLFQSSLALLFALALVKTTRVNTFYRALFFLPAVIASVSVAFIWTFVYDPALGLLNIGLQHAGLDNWIYSWLGDKNLAIYSLAVIQVWAHTGQVLIIFITGLQAIPTSLYEAARIDGANQKQTFRHITLPLLAPAATIVVGYTTLQAFKAFDLILATTNGGPAGATEILSLFLYHQAFDDFKFGYASASAIIYMIIIATITLLQFKILNSRKV